MINAISLSDNKLTTLTVDQLQTVNLSNLWLEVVDPSEQELQAVSSATQVPLNFLRFPKIENWVELRLESGACIINFPVTIELAAAKKVQPLILAFSKNFLVTVARKDAQSLIDLAKGRMTKNKNDPPSLIAYFIIDEIVAGHFKH